MVTDHAGRVPQPERPVHGARHSPRSQGERRPRPRPSGGLGRGLTEATEARQQALDALPQDLGYPAELPISARRQEVVDAIAHHQVVVVAGETGSGKSTQLPKLCLEAGRGRAGVIGHTQPRRIAARSIAERVAEELRVPLGRAVGYKVRFTDRVSAGTLIKVMTDGVLLAELNHDRDLSGYDTLIIDEAHERSLNIDFILGYLKRLLPSRPDLKVVITSATIDTERFSAHFGGAPVIEVSGRTYPVEVRYRPWGEAPAGGEDEDETDAADLTPALTPSRLSQPSEQARGPRADDADEAQDEVQAVCDAVEELCQEGPGDILAFFPGEREIRDAAEALSRRSLRDLEVLALYGRLSTAEQHRVFEAHRGRRVVLATNVAETSLTVPGIRYVVDTGTARISRYSRRTKVQRLPIEAISQASADQRAGRCGRLGPGVCIRLYSPQDYASRPRFTEPEILRTNLASVVLQMAAIGLGDVEGFPFVEPPDRRNIKDGVALLEELGAFAAAPPLRGGASEAAAPSPGGASEAAAPSPGGATSPGPALTGTGRRLARLPLDPRLGRMVLEGARLACLNQILVIVSGLSVQDPRERPVDKRDAAAALHARFADDSSDFVSYLRLWAYLEQRQAELSSGQFRRMCKREMISYQRGREWQDVYGQLAEICRQERLGSLESLEAQPDVRRRAALHQALLAGLVTQVGVREGDRADFAAPRNARFAIWAGSVLAKSQPRWVMAAELVETSRLWARVVAPVRPQWVERAAAHLLQWTYSAPEWSAPRGGAHVVARATLFGLPVVVGRQVAMSTHDPEQARYLFILYALVEGDWDGAPDLVERNRECLGRTIALLQRARRPELIVGQQALFDFYDGRLPASVTSGAAFLVWWRDERRRRPELLDATPDDLSGGPGVDVDLDDFPETWPIGADQPGGGGEPLALTYNWQPGSQDDGVRAEVPLAQLNRLAQEGLEWQVPGLRQELVVQLLRSLPKELRRHLVPMPEHAREFVAKCSPSDGALLDVLARRMSEAGGTVITPRDFDWARVPAHLRPTFCVVGERGQVLAAGKEISALEAQLRPQMELALEGALRASPLGAFSARHFTHWEFGDLPRLFEPEWNGYRLRGYIALQDQGEGVSVRAFPDEASQAGAMFAGTRRLLLLGLGQRRHLVASIETMLGNQGRLSLAALGTLAHPPYRSTAQLAEDILVASVEPVLMAAGGPVWSAAAFDRLSRRIGQEVPELSRRTAKIVARVLAQTHDLRRRLNPLMVRASGLSLSSPVRVAAEDIEAQLSLLVGPRFIRIAGAARLADIERYLTAIERRLEKLPAAPARDMALTQRVQAVAQRLASARASARSSGVAVSGGSPLEEARWLLEELRVSLFAQSLGTKVPVSEERVLRLIEQVGL